MLKWRQFDWLSKSCGLPSQTVQLPAKRSYKKPQDLLRVRAGRDLNREERKAHYDESFFLDALGEFRGSPGLKSRKWA
jgi:hypothetical protein